MHRRVRTHLDEYVSLSKQGYATNEGGVGHITRVTRRGGTVTALRITDVVVMRNMPPVTA